MTEPNAEFRGFAAPQRLVRSRMSVLPAVTEPVYSQRGQGCRDARRGGKVTSREEEKVERRQEGEGILPSPFPAGSIV